MAVGEQIAIRREQDPRSRPLQALAVTGGDMHDGRSDAVECLGDTLRIGVKLEIFGSGVNGHACHMGLVGRQHKFQPLTRPWASRAALEVDDLVVEPLAGFRDGLRPIARAELSENRLDMEFHGVQGDLQFARNGLVGKTL